MEGENEDVRGGLEGGSFAAIRARWAVVRGAQRVWRSANSSNLKFIFMAAEFFATEGHAAFLEDRERAARKVDAARSIPHAREMLNKSRVARSSKGARTIPLSIGMKPPS